MTLQIGTSILLLRPRKNIQVRTSSSAVEKGERGVEWKEENDEPILFRAAEQTEDEQARDGRTDCGKEEGRKKVLR